MSSSKKMYFIFSTPKKRPAREEKLRLFRVKRLFVGCHLWKYMLHWLGGSCGSDRFDGMSRVSPRSPCRLGSFETVFETVFCELEMPSRSTSYRSTSGYEWNFYRLTFVLSRTVKSRVAPERIEQETTFWPCSRALLGVLSSLPLLLKADPSRYPSTGN